MPDQSITPPLYNRYRPMPPLCAVEDCERPARGRGWCRLHWQRWYRWGDPLQEHQPPKPIPLTKICNRCRLVFPRTPAFFHRNSRRLDGLYGTCKTCLLAHHRDLYYADIEKTHATAARWRNANREKVRMFSRKQRAKNPDKKRAETRAWRAANPGWQKQHWNRRRFKKMGTFVEDVDPSVLYDRDKGRCGVCKRKVARGQMSIDHIIPLTFGGEHSYKNTQLAHRGCNSRRGNRGPAQTRMMG